MKRRMVAMITSVLMAAMSLAACGGGSASTTAAPASTASAETTAAAAQSAETAAPAADAASSEFTFVMGTEPTTMDVHIKVLVEFDSCYCTNRTTFDGFWLALEGLVKANIMSFLIFVAERVEAS